MLITEYETADPAAMHRPPIAAERIERYVREKANGALVIREGEVPEPPSERRVDLIFCAGRVGNDGGEWLFHVGLWTPVDYRDEFVAWYRMEHLPMLLECPSWDGCRFVEEKVADGCQFYAMHQLVDVTALDSDQRRFSRSTAWFSRLQKHTWFDAAFTRTLFRRAS